MNLERVPVPIIYIGINNLSRKITYNWNYKTNENRHKRYFYK